MPEILKTGISPAGDKAEASHLDLILRGGLRVPTRKELGNEVGLTALVTGPPGAGKTVLSLELCHRLAAERGKVCLYCSVESNSKTLLKYGEESEFNWNDLWPRGSRRVFLLQDKFEQLVKPETGERVDSDQFIDPRVGGLMFVGTEQLQEAVDSSASEPITAQGFLDRLAQGVRQTLRGIHNSQRRRPEVVVIDNLNIVPDREKAEKLFQDIRSALLPHVQLVIFIFEGSIGPTYNFWEYIADMVIALDVYQSQEYVLHSLEIRKSRRQDVRWGKHQMKIKAMRMKTPQDPEEVAFVKPQEKTGEPVPAGVRLYLSQHLQVSLGDRSCADRPAEVSHVPLPTPNYEKLNTALGGGVLQRKMTAWLGERGTMKTSIGYDFLVDGAAKKEQCLLFSLCEDESAIKSRFDELLTARGMSVEDSEVMQNLQYYYFRPGYIAPDEFLYVLTRKIETSAKEGRLDRLVIDDVAQLRPSFPLCRKTEGFLSAIRDVIYTRGITTFVLGVTGPGEDAELNFDLGAMSEVVLKLSRMLDKTTNPPEPCVILTVDRVAPPAISGKPLKVTALPTPANTRIKVEDFPAGWQGLQRLP